MSNQNFFFNIKNFIFLKFHCSKILSHFYFIFQFFFRNLLFTVDRSTITVHWYCSQLLFTQYTALGCDTKFCIVKIQFAMLQYKIPISSYFTLYCNTKFQVYLNTQHSKCIVLQYNFQQYKIPSCLLHHYIAI